MEDTQGIEPCLSGSKPDVIPIYYMSKMVDGRGVEPLSLRPAQGSTVNLNPSI